MIQLLLSKDSDKTWGAAKQMSGDARQTRMVSLRNHRNKWREDMADGTEVSRARHYQILLEGKELSAQTVSKNTLQCTLL